MVTVSWGSGVLLSGKMKSQIEDQGEEDTFLYNNFAPVAER